MESNEAKKEKLRKSLEQELPPIIAREEIHKYTGGIYTAGTMANADSKGEGPEEKIRIERRKIAYPKKSLIDWILKRITFL